MRFRIKHVTRYAYGQPVSHSHNDVRLAPIDAQDQKRVAFRLEVTPPAVISEYRDTFGNLAHSIDIEPPHNELIISSASVVERLILPTEPSPRITILDYLADDSARMKEYGIVDSGDTLRDGIGAMTDARAASFFDKMTRAGVVRSDIDFRKAYTLRFVNRGVGLDLRPKN